MKKVCKTIGRVLLIALGFFLLLIALFGALVSHPDDKRIVRSAVVLEKPILLPENEGKTVIIEGALTGETPVTEDLFSMTFDAPLVKRYDEVYAYERGTRTGHWDWKEDQVKVFHKTLSIGEFELDEELIMRIPTPVSLTEAELKSQLPPSIYVFPDDDDIYISVRNVVGVGFDIISHDHEGTMRYRYRLPRVGETYTILGIQREGKLYLHENINEASVQVSSDGVEGMLSDLRNDTIFGVVFSVIAAAVCLFFGFKGILYLKPDHPQKRRQTP